MSTRGVIAWRTPKGWRGRYHHSDSYPTGLGKSLRDIYQHFGGDIKAMKRVLFHEHTSWSCVVGKDFSLEPGYFLDAPHKREMFEAMIEAESIKGYPPSCYCHGDRHEEGWIETPKGGPSDREWCYVIDPKTGAVEVLRRAFRDEEKYDSSYWAPAGAFALDGPEPDWQAIECGPNLEWCGHCKSYHDKTICPKCDGKKALYFGGHTTDPAFSVLMKDCKNCVPVERLPEPIKTYYLADPRTPKKNWHVFSPRLCDKCGGTGKAKAAKAG